MLVHTRVSAPVDINAIRDKSLNLRRTCQMMASLINRSAYDIWTTITVVLALHCKHVQRWKNWDLWHRLVLFTCIGQSVYIIPCQIHGAHQLKHPGSVYWRTSWSGSRIPQGWYLWSATRRKHNEFFSEDHMSRNIYFRAHRFLTRFVSNTWALSTSSATRKYILSITKGWVDPPLISKIEWDKCQVDAGGATLSHRGRLK